MKVAVVFHHIGPYHHARLNAAGRAMEVLGIEWSAEDNFGWGDSSSGSFYRKMSLFPKAVPGSHDPAALSARMLAVFREFSPEVIAVNGWGDFGSLLVLECGAKINRPMVMMSESTVWDEQRSGWKEWTKGRIVRRCSAGLAGGEPHADYLVRLGIPRDRVFLGYDAVDNDYFATRTDEVRNREAEIRKKYQLPQSYFLASARFIEKKNLPRLLEAYARYRQMESSSGPPWDLVLLGDGALRKALESQLASLKLQPHVMMPGFKPYPDLPAFYAFAGAFVHASTTEQWGLVVNEAMASGLPVLVSNRCGCAPDLVKDGINGFAFDPHDVENLARLMSRLAGSTPEQLASFGRAGRNLVAEWGPARFAEGLLAAGNAAKSVGPMRPDLSTGNFSPRWRTDERGAMTPIRTANLTGSISRNAGGLHESVRRLMQSLGELEVGVRIFGVADEFTAADMGVWSPVPVSVFKPYWPAAFGFSPGFYRELADYKPDLMHTHGIWMYPSVVTNRYCAHAHVPFMISPHGMLDRWAIQNSRWKKAIAYALYEGAHLREAGCIRALCQSEADSIRELGLTNPICVVPNGIDLPDAQDSVGPPVPPWSGRVEPGRKVALFLSRIHPKKGLVNLLRAWRKAREEKGGSDWVLAIAGWDQGGHEAELKELAGNLGLAFLDIRTDAASNGSPSTKVDVIFLGPQFGAGKQGAYAACDAFILPSFSEGLPMVVLEAWAHTKPVVMTPECNIPEGFAAGAAIEIPTDAEGISRGLARLFGMSPDQLKAMGGAGRQLVLDKFVWNRIAADVKAVYQWMLGGGSPPAVVRLD